MHAYLFPGQGAQCLGMGKILFDLFPNYVAQTDRILGYSICELCLEDKENQLQNTRYTQPALYVVNALTYLKTIEETKQKPDYVAGHSLGEYNALFAAGVFDFDTGLKLVKKRGELMSLAEGGAMAAVVGLCYEELDQVLKKYQLSSLTIANINSYQQLVISGPKTDIEQSQAHFLNQKGVYFVPLPVSGAFHSPFMREAGEAFSDFLKDFNFATPNIPVIANLDAAPYHPEIIKKNLVNQMTYPVQWVKTIEYLEEKPNMEFQEIGPGTLLKGLLNRIKNKQ
jgi:malonyl CoA-acyl carrier protein transacylase